MNPANPYLTALMPLAGMILLIAVAYLARETKKQFDEHKNLQERIKENQESKSRADQVFARTQEERPECGLSMVDEKGLILLPDDYYPYDQSK